MTLSEADDPWNKMALAQADLKRRFIKKAIEEGGFTEQQAVWWCRFVDLEKFERSQDFADIFTRPID